MVVQENAVEGVFQGGEGAFATLGLQLALPDSDAVPSELGQLFLVALVALFVACDFSTPERRVGFRHFKILASVMPMPETAIDEDAGAVFPHHQVGMPWQPVMKQPIPKTS